MISAIVYTSNSGYTAEYARLLGRATGLPVNDLRQVHTPQPDEEVIFLGWLMADRVMGWPKANAFFKVRAVCQVGMGPASAAAAAPRIRYTIRSLMFFMCAPLLSAYSQSPIWCLR